MDSFGVIIIVLLGAMGCAWIIAKPATDKAEELEKKLKLANEELEKQKLIYGANVSAFNSQYEALKKEVRDNFSILREKQADLKEILSSKRPVITFKALPDAKLIKQIQAQMQELAKVPNGPPKSN